MDGITPAGFRSPGKTTATPDQNAANVLTVDYSDEVAVRCRVCLNHGRRPSTFVVLRRITYSPEVGDLGFTDLRIDGLANPDRFPTIAYRCKNRSCKAISRTTQVKLAELYVRSVEKRLGAIYL